MVLLRAAPGPGGELAGGDRAVTDGAAGSAVSAGPSASEARVAEQQGAALASRGLAVGLGPGDYALAAFTTGWRIDSIEPATVDTNVHPTGVRGWLAALTRTNEDTPC